MKNLLNVILFLLLFLSIPAQDIVFAQDNQTRFYADLVSKAATLKSNWGLFGGLRAGYNINDNVSIGLAAHGLIPERLGGSYVNQKGMDELHLGYGGAEAAYNYWLSEKFYLTGMIMIGAGRVDYDILPGNDYFFISEPGASFNYQVTDWFGLGYSFNYRFAAGVRYADLSDAALSGWSTALSFKFGF